MTQLGLTPAGHGALFALNRITKAAARLSDRILATGDLTDPDGDVELMAANLAHLARALEQR